MVRSGDAINTIPFSIIPIISQYSSTHWSQSFQWQSALGIIEVYDKNGNARQIGVLILTKLSRFIEESSRSFEAIQNFIKHIEESKYASLTFFTFNGSTISVFNFTKNHVYLLRSSSLVRLVDKEGSVEGTTKSNDKIIVFSPSFQDSIVENRLLSLIQKSDEKNLKESVELELHKYKSLEAGGMLIILIHQGIIEESNTASIITGEKKQRRFTHTKEVVYARLIKLARRLRITKKLFQIVVFAVITLAFLASVLIGITKKMNDQKRASAQSAIILAQSSYDEAMSLISLNPQRSRDKLLEGKEKLLAVEHIVSEKSKEGRQIHELLQNIANNMDLAMRISHVKPVLYYDASLIKPQAGIDFITLVDDTMLGLFDKKNNTVFAVNIDSKNGQVVAGGEDFSGAIALSGSSDALFVLTANGIQEARLEDKKTIRNVIAKDESWNTVTKLYSYAGNQYILDVGSNRIWKYQSNQKGVFSERREYLNPDEFPQFQDVTSFAIDGSVWMGTNKGEVRKFSLGKEETFSLQGIEPSLGTELIVYTTDTLVHLYIVDVKNNRMVVVDKNGSYVAQYSWEKGIVPTDFVVSEDKKIVLLLVNGTIQSFVL